MKPFKWLFLLSALASAPPVSSQTPSRDEQAALQPATTLSGPTLRFNWPAIQIGVGSYEEGPTGLTIFRFPHRATGVVDVRGGGPGTVNSDALRLGYDGHFLDAVVFAGGSAYGEETITAVSTGLKDAGESSGRWGDIGFVTGAIIYDFEGHRLNEVYPDKRLARATLTALRPGVFPLGAQGAGRMAMQGAFFGCDAHSGQGGAFRQIGQLKIAAFTVVNAGGAIVDRQGRLVKCDRNPAWGPDEQVSDLLKRIGSGSLLTAAGPSGPTNNTTISLVVTNRKMSAAELQRLAVQVHTSMSRAIQPFSTADDGDTLFAVSTQEVDVTEAQLSDMQIDTISGELMWDAVLASVPAEPAFRPPAEVSVIPQHLAALAGRYRFGDHALMEIAADRMGLTLRSDAPEFFDLPHDVQIRLTAASETEFYVAGRHRTRIHFILGSNGRAVGATINPGSWAQQGTRLQ